MGPVRVLHRGRSVLHARRRERLLLGLLALEANRPVSVGRLEQLLWDGNAPQKPREALQVYASRLRAQLKAVGGGSEVWIDYEGDGYVLRVDPGRVDARRFVAQVAAARSVSDAGRRAQRLREALALWEGPLLADAAGEELRWRVGESLEETRLAAVESRVEAELEAGAHETLVSELADLTAAHPERERLLAARMKALYKCGRVAEALEAYRDAAADLSDRLGLDFGDELNELYVAMLRHDPALAAAPQPASPAPVPAQLPPGLSSFTGREAVLRTLDGLLDAGAAAGPVVISAISGAAGVGKTTLAVHWAHRIASRFPDGQLYVNLRGFDPSGQTTTSAEAIRGFLDALGVAKERVPAEPDAQCGLYRSLLSGKRVLVVLDNARDAEQVRPLLPGSPGCLAVVTSRNRLFGLVASESARPVCLDVLARDEARRLLAGRVGADRVAAEPDAVEAIVDACA
ncbi:MAG: BTAD domain-containing putative transcriptional regulator, partial [Stackebrandtia sp.]